MRIEKYFLRLEPFTWIYFNLGEYYTERRIVFEMWITFRGKVRGFSIQWCRGE